MRVTRSAAYQADGFRVRAGLVRIEFSGDGTALLEIPKIRGFALVIPSSLGPSVGTIRLRPGTYTVESPIGGHREAGQKATLVVTG